MDTNAFQGLFIRATNDIMVLIRHAIMSGRFFSRRKRQEWFDMFRGSRNCVQAQVIPTGDDLEFISSIRASPWDECISKTPS